MKFSQLLLECIAEWAVLYAQSGPNSIMPTKYKQFHSDLMKARVKFPQKHTYFVKAQPEISKSQSISAPPPKKSNLIKEEKMGTSKKDELKKEIPEENIDIPMRKTQSAFNQPTPNKPQPQRQANKDHMIKDIQNLILQLKTGIDFLVEAEEGSLIFKEIYISLFFSCF